MMQMNDWMLTPEDLADYAKRYGDTAAASLLLITPPDRFAGDYEEAFASVTVTTELTTNAKA
jgi:hypothetical protein